MLRLTCFALLLSLVLGLELQAKIRNEWQKFKSVHGKKYSGAEEERRKEIFKKNVQSILEHNLRYDMGEVTYTRGVNQFADMDEDEFQNMFGGIYTPFNATKKILKSRKSSSPPESLDYHDEGAVAPVRHQGSCGSCWAFAAAGTVEGAWALKHGHLVEISKQHLLDCTPEGNARCKGGLVDTAVKYIIKNKGVNIEECYPYKAENSSVCYYDPTCRTIQIKYYYHFFGEDELFRVLWNYGPVSVGIYVDPRFGSYEKGVFDVSDCILGPRTYHFVTLIGYGKEDGKDYWLVKNSWGSKWGESGFAKIVRNKSMCTFGQDNVVAVA